MKISLTFCSTCQQHKPTATFFDGGRLLAACQDCRTVARAHADAAAKRLEGLRASAPEPKRRWERPEAYRRVNHDGPNVVLKPSDRDRASLEWTFENNPSLGLSHAARR